jgi:uncharacterized protein YigE (DUF2233 family)
MTSDNLRPWQIGLCIVIWLLAGCHTAGSNDQPPPTPILPTSITLSPFTPPPVTENRIPPRPSVTVTPSPTHTATPSPTPTITPSPTPLPRDTGWELRWPGLERRIIPLFDDDGQQTDSLFLLRIEPAFYEFGIAYHPGQPQSLTAWQEETGALVVVNGGFFTEEYVATGLIVIDGQASGVSYGEFAGMFAVSDGGPEIRWLAERPYNANESLQYGLQSFPILVKPGGVLGFTDESGRRARRTVVAQDGDGRILFLVASWNSFTLHGLSAYLVNSDLNLDIALNLDGGPSSGLILADPAEMVPAFLPSPAVITVRAR